MQELSALWRPTTPVADLCSPFRGRTFVAVLVSPEIVFISACIAGMAFFVLCSFFILLIRAVLSLGRILSSVYAS